MNAILGVVVGIPCAIYRAFAIVMMWQWFVVPSFHVAPLSKTVAYGLMLTAGLIHQQYVPNDESKTAREVFVESIVQSIVGTSMGLICGYIARGLM